MNDIKRLVTKICTAFLYGFFVILIRLLILGPLTSVLGYLGAFSEAIPSNVSSLAVTVLSTIFAVTALGSLWFATVSDSDSDRDGPIIGVVWLLFVYAADLAFLISSMVGTRTFDIMFIVLLGADAVIPIITIALGNKFANRKRQHFLA